MVTAVAMDSRVQKSRRVRGGSYTEQKPPRTIEREFVQGAFDRVFVLGLLKIGEVREV